MKVLRDGNSEWSNIFKSFMRGNKGTTVFIQKQFPDGT